MKKALFLLLLLSVGCGDKNTYVSDQPHGTTDQQFSENGSYEGEVLFAPKFYDLNAKTFFVQKNTFQSNDKRYISFESTYNKNIASLNHQHFPKGLKNIVIKGKDIVLEEGHDQEIFEQINSSPDIETLTIYADKLEISSLISLPGARVEIYAKDLIISKEGAIDITPLTINHRAQQFNDGAHGIDAREIKLFVENINLNLNQTKKIFILNGGNGQEAGAGQKGNPGSRLRDLGGGAVFIRRITEFCEYMDPVRFKSSINKRRHCSEIERTEGSPSWPTNGGPAVPGGRPGDGGNGGQFFSTVNINRDLISFDGGVSGKWAGVIEGGDPGVPRVSYHTEVHFRNGTRSQSHTSAKGADVSSPIAEIAVGTKGEYVVVEDKLSWINEGAVEFLLKYGDDLYLNNNIENAKRVFSKIDKYVDLFEKRNETNSLKFEQIINEYELKRNKIEGQLDYFGHRVTWVPNLSLETYYSRFEKEIEKSIQTLYLAYWVNNSQRSIEDKSKALSNLQDKIELSIENDSANFNLISEKIPVLKEEVAKVKIDEKYFKDELNRVNAEIEKMARNNIISRNKESLLKKVIKTAAAISKVIPAGQPALGSIGVGLSSVLNVVESDSPFSSILDEAPNLYNSYENFNYEESRESWNSAWEKVKFSNYRELTTDKERREYLRDVINFSKPIIQGIRDNSDIWSSRQVPRNEVEDEILRIQNSHPIFQNIVTSLRSLLNKKKSLNGQIQMIDRELGETIVRIQNGLVEVGEITDRKSFLGQGSDKKLIPLIKKLREEANIRLQKYQYHLSKAYEYRVLRPYRKNLNNQALVEKILDLIQVDQEGNLSSEQYNQLRSVYLDSLSMIAFETLEHYEENGLPQQKEKTIYLSSEEIDALNSGKSIVLDFIGEKIFNDTYRDIRINNILVDELTIEQDVQNARVAEVSLDIKHCGQSFLQNDEGYFLFEEDELSKNKRRWGATLDVIGDELSQVQRSESAMSLMKVLMGENSTESILLFSRIGALTQLELSLTKNSIPKKELSVDNIALKVIYDYSL
jgi:vancomycin resistance protein YoaR